MWMKNLTRALTVMFTIVIALWLNEKLSKFIAFLGAFACIPITFILPNLFHYKLVSETVTQKRIDVLMIVISILLSIFCTVFTLVTWSE